ncbi:Predicted DNA-binding transcriptional regulator YafY, contains an HTH and WYL domains [Desulfotomaculum arcticum]|uniref:Predicted DNA-binding transcriptional regulator YafY, contains an HTH and WYL domains n=1 Tax=Desulfotruncus arcticus DSM 17038 TaxID=1121424 RepID=A0A1I2YTX1_9FIRM|nr:YafY family protein [Desulfotruncus arcticus]SFH29072.1 Predicted DNA-binding transcriptional regulator YafY, contains an HTH and WYL domains [Desulfotomaculum arcticum] [Desulfotruncus arcticus DSM 17038]
MSESRLFKIIYHLLDKGRASAPELAEVCEVSVRTIYRDIDMLSGAGIPIYANTGRNGGIRLQDHFMLRNAILSEKEKQEILMGVQSLSAIQYPAADDILMKLGAVFQTAQANWIEVDFSRWGSIKEKEQKVFDILKQAILERKVIRFTYYSSSGNTLRRDAEPVKLLYKDKSWYVFAFCPEKSDYRLFRVSRMKEIVLTGKTFEMKAESSNLVLPIPEDLGALLQLELSFPDECGYRLYDTFDESAISKTESGYKVQAALPENEWLYDFIMSFGDKVTVIWPERLKDNIIQRYENALRHYRKEQ